MNTTHRGSVGLCSTFIVCIFISFCSLFFSFLKPFNLCTHLKILWLDDLMNSWCIYCINRVAVGVAMAVFGISQLLQSSHHLLSFSYWLLAALKPLKFTVLTYKGHLMSKTTIYNANASGWRTSCWTTITTTTT